jgi:hypothetical protein
MNTNGTTKLEPAEYWRLRASAIELERDQIALVNAQNRVEATRARHETLWQAMTSKYQLDPHQKYAARDDDCALVSSQADVPVS